VAQRVGRGTALLFHDRGTRRGWVVSSKPRPHFTPGKDPVPILREAGWAPGPVWTGGKSRSHRYSIPDSPVCSQSLYRLSYKIKGKVEFTMYETANLKLICEESKTNATNNSCILRTSIWEVWRRAYISHALILQQILMLLSDGINLYLSSKLLRMSHKQSTLLVPFTVLYNRRQVTTWIKYK